MGTEPGAHLQDRVITDQVLGLLVGNHRDPGDGGHQEDGIQQSGFRQLRADATGSICL